jgi:hypothetical protein
VELFRLGGIKCQANNPRFLLLWGATAIIFSISELAAGGISAEAEPLESSEKGCLRSDVVESGNVETMDGLRG